ncbi:hypothetical protein BDZ89DRAFT_1109763 [Hymenopellis radicata]|nr:hypothetical protein BDZ89DRAFT_1109763 [Hymenopellis radicata]
MAASMNPQFELLTSTRYDRQLEHLSWNKDSFDAYKRSPFLVLPYHYERLRKAAEDHRWTEALAAFPSYESFKSAALDAVANAAEPAADAYKVRFTLGQSGTLRVSASPTPPWLVPPKTQQPPPSSIRTQIPANNTQPTPPSIFTYTKTTHRKHYDDARARAGLPILPSPDLTSEVIIYNNDRCLTEGSISNIAFYKSGYWYTPHERTGCLPGVLRRWLVEQGRLRETKPGHDYTPENLAAGSWVLIINSVLGCRVGKIQKG